MSPSLIIALLLAAIGAQITQMATGFVHHYLGLLLAAIIGVVLGEVVAGLAGGGPQLGSLHPLCDLLAMAGCEVIATTFLLPTLSPRRP